MTGGNVINRPKTVSISFTTLYMLTCTEFSADLELHVRAIKISTSKRTCFCVLRCLSCVCYLVVVVLPFL